MNRIKITSTRSQLKVGEAAELTFSFSEDPGDSFGYSDIEVFGGTLDLWNPYKLGTGTVEDPYRYTARFVANAVVSNYQINVNTGSFGSAGGSMDGVGATLGLKLQAESVSLHGSTDRLPYALQEQRSVLNLQSYSNQYATLPKVSLGGDLSLEAWVNLRNITRWGRVFEIGDGAATNNIVVAVSPDGNFHWEIYDHGVSMGVVRTKAFINEWVHLAGVVTADSNNAYHMKLYVNGQQVGTETVFRSNSFGTSVMRKNTYIGKSNWYQDDYLDGMVRDVRIYDDARSTEEIRSDMSSAVVDTDQLKAAYSFNQSNANQIAGQPAATLSNNASYVPDRYSFDGSGPARTFFQQQVLNFNGNNQWVSLPNVMVGGDLTIETWILVKGQSNNVPIFTMRDGVANNQLILALNSNNQFTFQVDSGNRNKANVSAPIVLNEWVHLAAVVSSDGVNNYNAKLYVNGNAVGSGVNFTDADFGIARTRAETFIGKGVTSTDDNFNGLMRDLRIYDDARTTSEIRNDMFPNSQSPDNNSALDNLRSAYPLNGDFGNLVSGLPSPVARNGAQFVTSTIQNMPTTLQGAVGHALNLNGVNQYADLPDVSLGGDMTLEAWVNVRSITGWGRIFEIGNGAASDNLVLAITANGKLHWEIYSDKTSKFYIQAPAITNEWMHLAAVVKVVDNTHFAASLYINGEIFGREVEFSDASFINPLTRMNTFLGKSSWIQDKYFNGQIRQVRVYDDARSNSEIATDMLSATPDPDQLKLAYNFDDTNSSLAGQSAAILLPSTSKPLISTFPLGEPSQHVLFTGIDKFDTTMVSIIENRTMSVQIVPLGDLADGNNEHLQIGNTDVLVNAQSQGIVNVGGTSWQYDYNPNIRGFELQTSDDSDGASPLEVKALIHSLQSWQSGTPTTGQRTFIISTIDTSGSHTEPTAFVLKAIFDNVAPTPEIHLASRTLLGPNPSYNSTFAEISYPDLSVGDTLQLKKDGSDLGMPYTVTAANMLEGKAKIQVTYSQLLANGSNSLTVVATDLLGNQGSSSAVNIQTDGTAPQLILALGSGVANGATSAEATAQSGVVTVNAEPGSSVAVTFTDSSGHSVIKMLTGTGAALAVMLDSSDIGSGADKLLDGAITVSATATDAAGNTSMSGSSFALDTHAPSINSNATYSVAENTTAVATLSATDSISSSRLVWSLESGGTDNALFDLSSAGELSFKSAPNYEAPRGPAYSIKVGVMDAAGNLQTQDITVNVTNVTNVNAPPSIGGIPASSQTISINLVNSLDDFTVADVDSTPLYVTLTPSSGGSIGGFTAGNAGGLVVAMDGNQVQLTGTATSINNALANATFSSSTTGTASVTVRVSDSSLADTAAESSSTATYNFKSITPQLRIASGQDAFVNSSESGVDVELSIDSLVSGDTVSLKLGADILGSVHTVTAAEASTHMVSLNIAKADLSPEGQKNIYAELTQGVSTTSNSNTLGLTLDLTPPATGSLQWLLGKAVNPVANLAEVSTGAVLFQSTEVDTIVKVTFTDSASHSLVKSVISTGKIQAVTLEASDFGTGTGQLSNGNITVTATVNDVAGNAVDGYAKTIVPEDGRNEYSANERNFTLDANAPQIQTAKVVDKILVLQLDDVLATDAAHKPNFNDFTVTVNGSSNAVTGIRILGSSVELTLTDKVATGATVSLIYTAPSTAADSSSGPLQDKAGNPLANISNFSVAESTPNRPVITSIVLTDNSGTGTDLSQFVGKASAGGHTAQVTFSEPVNIAGGSVTIVFGDKNDPTRSITGTIAADASGSFTATKDVTFTTGLPNLNNVEFMLDLLSVSLGAATTITGNTIANGGSGGSFDAANPSIGDIHTGYTADYKSLKIFEHGADIYAVDSNNNYINPLEHSTLKVGDKIVLEVPFNDSVVLSPIPADGRDFLKNRILLNGGYAGLILDRTFPGTTADKKFFTFTISQGQFDNDGIDMADRLRFTEVNQSSTDIKDLAGNDFEDTFYPLDQIYHIPTLKVDGIVPTPDLNGSSADGINTTTTIPYGTDVSSFRTDTAILPDVAAVSHADVVKIVLDFADATYAPKSGDRLKIGSINGTDADLDLNSASNLSHTSGGLTLGGQSGLDYTYDEATNKLTLFKHDGTAFAAANIDAALKAIQFKNADSLVIAGPRDFDVHLFDHAGNDGWATAQFVLPSLIL